MAKSTSNTTNKGEKPFEKFFKKKSVPAETFVPRTFEKSRPTSTFFKPKTEDRKPVFKSALDEKINKRISKLNDSPVFSKRETASGTNPAIKSFPVGPKEEMRLNKFLSNAGVASRRKADELIEAGKVTVNGQPVTEMGYKVKPEDKVVFDGKRIAPERKVYILINKPKDCITTVSDEKDRKTVLDLIKPAYAELNFSKNPRLYPVGRLDRNTTGVLLITNDGELAQNLTHPSREIQKIYHVHLDKVLTQVDFDKIRNGVVLEDGFAEVDEIAFPNPKSKIEVGVQIHSGRNRIVRRIFESLGYQVVKLDRVFFGGLTKKDLPKGRWRFLSEEEVRRLKYFIPNKSNKNTGKGFREKKTKDVN